MSCEVPAIEEKLTEDSFKEQTEKLVVSCSTEQLAYLEKAIYNEREFRTFSAKKVELLRDKLKQMEKDFDKKMNAKKQLLAAKFINEEVEDESEEESGEELAPIKKRKNSPSKKNKRKN